MADDENAGSIDWSVVAAEAHADLQTRLRQAGIDHDVAPSFGPVWDAMVAWAAKPVVEHSGRYVDECNLLVAWHEPTAQGGWSYFYPPEVLRPPLLGLSFQRSVGHPPDPDPDGVTAHGLSHLDLYFKDSPEWAALAQVDGYLGRQASLPALDYFVDSSRLGELDAEAVIQIASRHRLLGYSGRDGQSAWTPS